MAPSVGGDYGGFRAWPQAICPPFSAVWTTNVGAGGVLTPPGRAGYAFGLRGDSSLTGTPSTSRRMSRYQTVRAQIAYAAA